MNIVEVKNLTFSYDKKISILDDVSFSIEKGDFVSIIGHNGSGKSTLTKILVGLIKPMSGTVSIDGDEITDKTLSIIRSKVCLVFQNPDNQFIGSTVEDDIAFGLENHRVPQPEMKDIVIKYAKAVGMEKFLNKEPQMLSGGQKQRVAIAGALALKPEILILDESTSMLDPKGKQDILALLRSIKNENPNLTVIQITHDVEEAFMSNKIIVLGKGKILKIGTPEEVFKDNKILSESHLGKPFVIQMREKLNLKDDVIDTDSLLEAICQSK